MFPCPKRAVILRPLPRRQSTPTTTTTTSRVASRAVAKRHCALMRLRQCPWWYRVGSAAVSGAPRTWRRRLVGFTMTAAPSGVFGRRRVRQQRRQSALSTAALSASSRRADVTVVTAMVRLRRRRELSARGRRAPHVMTQGDVPTFHCTWMNLMTRPAWTRLAA